MKGFLITTSSHQERWFEHIVTAFYIVVFTITIITNAFLFTVFFRNKSFRDLSTFLLVQMAGADVVYLCITGSIVAVKNLEIELSRPLCKTLLYFEGVCRFASSFSLLLISLERSISVCSPTLCYSIRNISNVKIKVFVTVFVIALILRLGVFFVACDSTKWAPGYRLAVTASTYILPLVIELVAYVAAYHKIQQRIRNSSRSKQVLLFIRKSLKVFVLIVVVFAVCTLPSSILVILQSLRVYTPSYFLGYVVDLIECLPCVTNVICYLVCSPKFRSEIRKLLSVRSQRKSEDARHSSQEDGEDDGNGAVPRSKMKHDIQRATMKLDWVLGDDPSQVEIPKSPPGTDKPSFEIPSTLQEEKEEMELPTIEENEDTSFPNLSRKVVCGTWPRTKLTLLIDSRQKLDLANVEPRHSANTACDITDSGVSRSGSELDIDFILETLAVDSPASASEDSEKVVTGPRVGTTHAQCHQVGVRIPVNEGRSDTIFSCHAENEYLSFSE